MTMHDWANWLSIVCLTIALIALGVLVGVCVWKFIESLMDR